MGFKTTEQIQNVKILIDMCNKYNILLPLAFIDDSKAFDSIELWAVLKAMDDGRRYSRSRNLLKSMYQNETLQIQMCKIPIRGSVRQGDTISEETYLPLR